LNVRFGESRCIAEFSAPQVRTFSALAFAATANGSCVRDV